MVEDDATTRQMLVQVLSDDGFETFGAHDGAHALRAASARRPDVIVLDMGLPVLDGSGFVDQWRKHAGALGVPIVSISGLRHGETMAREVDAAAFFAKPIDLDRFLETVRGLASRHASRERGEEAEKPGPA